MKTTLGLELFDGSAIYMREGIRKKISPQNPWVAEIVGHTPTGYERRFVRSSRDYTKSNSRGSRGVYCWYLLDEGKIYQVQEQISWKNAIRYFCVIQDCRVVRITQEQADRLLAQRVQMEAFNA